MRAEILSIGTEILIGSILNTNSRFLSQKLAENAIDVYHHSTVGDNIERIADSFRLASERADIVISTGGLGPTEDDATLRGLAQYLNVRLVLHQPTYRHVLAKLRQAGFAKITKLIEKQCYVPQNAKLIFKNQFGTAPGILYETSYSKRKKWYLILPGPPREMQPMFLNQALPALKKLAHLPRQHFIIRTLKLAGVPESYVAQKIPKLLKMKPPITVGIYAKMSEVELKIMAKADHKKIAAKLILSVEKQIRKKFGHHIYGVDDETLSSVVGKYLSRQQKTLSVAESCTGGLVGNLLTETPGSSKYFRGGVICYDNRVKIEKLGIPKEMIKQHGAVSRSCAGQMAQNIRKIFGTDYSLGITGIAGPGGGTKTKPVGLVYIAVADKDKTNCKKYCFFGTRSEIKFRSAQKALDLLRLTLMH